MVSRESEAVEAYLDTIKRMEPDIAMVDHAAAIASIAISLKRIADVLEACSGGAKGDAAIAALW